MRIAKNNNVNFNQKLPKYLKTKDSYISIKTWKSIQADIWYVIYTDLKAGTKENKA